MNHQRHQSLRQNRDAEALLDAAEGAGAQYASDQIESNYFMSWVHEQLLEASHMDPSEVVPLDTRADFRRLAKNLLQQLEWDTKQDLDHGEILRLAGWNEDYDRAHASPRDIVHYFYKGFDGRLRQASTVDWLAGEVQAIHRSMETRPTAREAIPAYNILVVTPDAHFARKHERKISSIIQQPLVRQGPIRDGYDLEYGPIHRDDYRRLEGLLYREFGNAVRVRLVQVMYGGMREDSAATYGRTTTMREKRPFPKLTRLPR